MTIFHFALIRSFRRKLALVSMCAIPMAMIFMPSLWNSGDDLGYLFYAMLIMYIAFSLVRLLMTDRMTAAVVRIYAAPITTLQYLFQNLIAFWLIIMTQVFVVVILGILLYDWSITMAVLLVFSYGIFAAVSITFSLAWNSIFKSKVISDAVFGIVISFMALFGGIFIPISLLPDQIRKIGMIFPTYWITNALLTIQKPSGITALGEYWSSILIMLMFMFAFLLYGGKRRLE